MRFLVDECLSAQLVRVLSEEGHALCMSARSDFSGGGPGCHGGRNEQNRVLISADTDFGELLARSGESQPSVLLLRGPVRGAEVRAQCILANLTDVQADLDAGAWSS